LTTAFSKFFLEDADASPDPARWMLYTMVEIKKGDEIGYFQYRGSTYCLIFEPGVINSFVPKPPFHDDAHDDAPPLKTNVHVATAK
jgi:Phosphatidylserine decarboxylase